MWQIKIFSYLGFITIVIAIYGLFTIKNLVGTVNSQLIEVNKQLQLEKDHIHLLKAEFVFLTSPQRLRKLSEKYLAISTIKTTQMINDPLAKDNLQSVKVSDPVKPLPRKYIKWRYKRVQDKYLQTVSHRNNKLR